MKVLSFKANHHIGDIVLCEECAQKHEDAELAYYEDVEEVVDDVPCQECNRPGTSQKQK